MTKFFLKSIYYFDPGPILRYFRTKHLCDVISKFVNKCRHYRDDKAILKTSTVSLLMDLQCLNANLSQILSYMYFTVMLSFLKIGS